MEGCPERLAPVPVAGGAKPRASELPDELLLEIAEHSFGAVDRREQFDERDGEAWRFGGHEKLSRGFRPSSIRASTRCASVMARRPGAVTRKRRFPRPPRSGVGSPARDLTSPFASSRLSVA